MDEEKNHVEEGPHAMAVRKGGRPAAKHIDYKEFGRRLDDFMHKEGYQERDVARHVDLGPEFFTYESQITSARGGYKTSVETVEAIAKGLGLEVPYLDKAPTVEKRSPFGAGRKKGSGGGGRGRGADGGEDE